MSGGTCSGQREPGLMTKRKLFQRKGDSTDDEDEVVSDKGNLD